MYPEYNLKIEQHVQLQCSATDEQPGARDKREVVTLVVTAIILLVVIITTAAVVAAIVVSVTKDDSSKNDLGELRAEVYRQDNELKKMTTKIKRLEGLVFNYRC